MFHYDRYGFDCNQKDNNGNDDDDCGCDEDNGNDDKETSTFLVGRGRREWFGGF